MGAKLQKITCRKNLFYFSPEKHNLSWFTTRDGTAMKVLAAKGYFAGILDLTTFNLADRLSAELNKDVSNIKVLFPLRVCCEADCDGDPLYDLSINRFFLRSV
jgi:uncharacterized protein (UPF0261 family)